MAEVRPDLAPVKVSLRAELLAYWSGLGTITLSNGAVLARPYLSFPNDGFSPGSWAAFVELAFLSGSAVRSGSSSGPIRSIPGFIQAAVYVLENTGEELVEILVDRVVDTMRQVAALRTYDTDDPVPAPAPPSGYYGVVVRTSTLRVSQQIL